MNFRPNIQTINAFKKGSRIMVFVGKLIVPLKYTVFPHWLQKDVKTAVRKSPEAATVTVINGNFTTEVK